MFNSGFVAIRSAAPLLGLLLLPLPSALPASCVDNRGCSFNGVCSGGGRCACDPGWEGGHCESLRLAPARNGSGLSSLLHAGGSTSSWGGSVRFSPLDGRYHMWFSEITGRCGIHRWVSNSVVSHAVSGGPSEGWRFDRTGVVFPIFTHEPIAMWDPTSEEHILFVTHFDGPASDEPPCRCVNGNSASSPDPACAGEVGLGVNKTFYSYFLSSPDPRGPWNHLRSLTLVAPALSRTDLNLAPVIFANRSLVAWTRWNIWTAGDWRNVSTYRDDGQAPDWDDPTGQWEGEDPSLWVDQRGRFHILSHGGRRGEGGTSDTPEGNCGRHFFSESGRAGMWLAAPLPGGGCAYPRVNVTFADGSVRSFYRRERPHLVFGPDGFLPVALSTGVVDSPVGPGMPGFVPPQRDASYTLIQEVMTDKETEGHQQVQTSVEEE